MDMRGEPLGGWALQPGSPGVLEPLMLQPVFSAFASLSRWPLLLASTALAGCVATVPAAKVSYEPEEFDSTTTHTRVYAATEAQTYQRTVSREVSSKAVAELKARGMVHNEIAPAELARMQAEVKPVHDKFAASYDPAVVSLFKSELERVSKL